MTILHLKQQASFVLIYQLIITKKKNEELDLKVKRNTSISLRFNGIRLSLGHLMK